MTSNYSKRSCDLTKAISKQEKKNNGIYFTPPKTVRANIQRLKPYMENVRTVLEPSCGSCEYITLLHEQYKNVKITGIELNKTIYGSVKELENENITICNEDYLKYNSENYDLILGNPPYFVIKKKDVGKEFLHYFDGRPNIFILFIIKALKSLNPNGILSFVLPKNFLNCLYYDKTRKYIFENYSIIDIIECNDDYIETKQETIIIIIQNSQSKENNNSFTFEINNFTIFGTPSKLELIKSLQANSKTLYEMGFDVKVGNVVWNQCKKLLTDDKTRTRLIYSSDIENNKLVMKKYKNPEKRNFIEKEGITEPVLIMNRGYGVGNYKFNYYLLDRKEPYLLENHLIYVKSREPLNKKDVIQKLKNVIYSFENNKTRKFIELYFGNNAINTTELCKILPIYDI